MESFPQVPGYVVTGKLGSGSDSEVFKCRKKNSKKTLAVKIITKNQGAERLERSRKEVEVLSLLQHHPHIIRMHEWFETDDALYIVLENAEGGDLFEVLYSNELNPTQSVLEEECARRIFTQTAMAVRHMHQKGVCHRDLKPENIFLDREWNVKVGDFGLSLRFQPGRKVTDPVGSLIYASPEVLRREPYLGPELDVWALGVLLYEMLCGTPPFVGESETDLCRAILEGEYFMPDFVSSAAQSLISKMVKIKQYRISLEEIFQHPWVVGTTSTKTNTPRRKRQGSNLPESHGSLGQDPAKKRKDDEVLDGAVSEVSRVNPDIGLESDGEELTPQKDIERSLKINTTPAPPHDDITRYLMTHLEKLKLSRGFSKSSPLVS